MRFHLLILAVFITLLALGCVSSPPANTSTPTTNTTPPTDIDAYIETLPEPEIGPGEQMLQCGEGHEGEECFEEALEACGRAAAAFWSTSDGQVLDFESAGLDVASLAEGKELCKVRVYVNAESQSAFAGTSATCLLEKNAEGIYDAYDIGPDHCVGTYVDEINRTAATNNPPAQAEPIQVRVITLTTDDDGFRDASNTRITKVPVDEGERIKFVFISSTTNNSFGGQAIKSVGQELFTYPNIAPGASVTTDELVVTQPFTVQTWWPSFQVKKGQFDVFFATK